MSTNATRKTRFSAIDLFCGCGGLSLGLRRAGFKVVAGLDNDGLSINTFRMNYPRTRLIQEDVSSADPYALMDKLEMQPGSLDLLAGCPPCQGFSALRTLNGARSVSEPMNDLVFELVRFARIFRPKTLMMENVPALLNDDRLGRVSNLLSDIGYGCRAAVFNAEEYGVPQRRLRMILFGARDGCPSFGSPACRRRTVAQAIRRLPSPEVSEDPAHNYIVRRAEHVVSLIRRVPKNGGSRKDLRDIDQLECHKRVDGFRDVYGRMAWRKVAPTITSGCINPSKGRYIHPEEDRAITLREAALLQGFPKSYAFDMSRGRYAVAKMIGNAFPPRFAEHHARSIIRHLETHFQSQ